MALVRVPHECRLRIGGHSSHVAPRSRTEGERLSAGLVPFYRAWAGHNPPGAARARGKLACCASSREAASAVARARVSRENRLRKVEAAASTSYHGLALMERGFLLVQCSFIGNGSATSRPGRRTRAERLRAAPRRERKRAHWRVRACHAKAGYAKWRPPLARRTTVSHRRGEAFRRCSVLS